MPKRMKEESGTEELGLGAQLRRAREQRGIGLRQLAREVGLSVGYLSNVERGVFPPPADERLRALAVALGLKPEALVARKAATTVSPEMKKIMKRHPLEFNAIVRAIQNFGKADFLKLKRWLQAQKKEIPVHEDWLNGIGKPIREFMVIPDIEPVPKPPGSVAPELKAFNEGGTPQGRAQGGAAVPSRKRGKRSRRGL